MTRVLLFLSPITFATILTSCGNKVEEIKDPATGKILKRFEYYVDDNGQNIKDGEYKEWDRSGKLIADWNYVEDSLDGTCITVHDDGTTYTNNFKKGRMFGEQIMKNREGIILSKRNAKDDLPDGLQLFYNPDGSLKTRQQFKDGVPVGTWNFYRTAGSFNLHFANGICQELIGSWNENGSDRSYMIFGKDGSFQFWSPDFRFADPRLQMDGRFRIIDDRLQVSHQDRLLLYYDFLNVTPNRVELMSEAQEFSPAEKVILTKR